MPDVMSSVSAVRQVPLLERGTVMTELAGALDSAARGVGGTVFVTGEAGIGKTSVVERFSAECGAPRVLWGACEALFTPRPLGPLHDIARRTGGRLLELLTTGASREAVFAASLAELERAPSPALVVIEDVHWADEATLDWLKFLGRRVPRLAALIVATYRDDEIVSDHPLRAVIGALPPATVRRLALARLTPGAVAALAREAGRDPAELYRVSAGNPFFVSELLGAPPGEVPQSVRDAVLARAAKLGGPARDALEAVAVVPGFCERWLLADVVGDDPAALDACLATGVLQVQDRDRAIVFRHELARLAVEQSLPPDKARRWHRTVFEALERRAGERSVSASRLVHHAASADDGVAVLRLAPRAADQAAAVGAHRQALAHLTTALQFAGGLPAADRAALYDRRAYECYVTEQHAAGITDRLAAMALWREVGDERRAGDDLRWLSRMSWFLGRRADAERYADDAVALLGRFPESRELAMAYSNRAHLAMLSWDDAGAIAWGNRAIALAERLGDADVLVHALNNVGTAMAQRDYRAGVARLRRSLELAVAGGFQEHVARGHTNLGCVMAERCEPEAATVFDAGIAWSEDRDLDAWTLYMTAWRARHRWQRADFAAAVADAERVLGHPTASLISRTPALSALGRAYVRMGDDRALAVLDEALELALATTELQRIAPVRLGRAELAWLSGDDAGARRELDEVYTLSLEHRHDFTRGEIALWLQRAGGLAAIPDGVGEPFALELAGDWRGAAAAWQRLDCPVERALALALAGDEPALREAFDILSRVGALGVLKGLRHRLKARGAGAIPRGSRRSTRANPAGLTNRQLDVLRLLAQGLPNAAIASRLGLSQRTVDHHVSAVLGKIGAATRAEAAAIAVARGIAVPRS
jgi:DNA-binding CsgD family transcriptional regulator